MKREDADASGNQDEEIALQQHRTLIGLYLITELHVMREIGLFDVPGVRIACQLFVLGMVDMLRSVNKLESPQFMTLLRGVLADHDLTPETSVERFADRAGRAAQTSNVVGRIIDEGTKSIRSYVVDRDADAPTDLGRIALYAQKNAKQLMDAMTDHHVDDRASHDDLQVGPSEPATSTVHPSAFQVAKEPVLKRPNARWGFILVLAVLTFVALRGIQQIIVRQALKPEGFSWGLGEHQVGASAVIPFNQVDHTGSERGGQHAATDPTLISEPDGTWRQYAKPSVPTKDCLAAPCLAVHTAVHVKGESNHELELSWQWSSPNYRYAIDVPSGWIQIPTAEINESKSHLPSGAQSLLWDAAFQRIAHPKWFDRPYLIIQIIPTKLDAMPTESQFTAFVSTFGPGRILSPASLRDNISSIRDADDKKSAEALAASFSKSAINVDVASRRYWYALDTQGDQGVDIKALIAGQFLPDGTIVQMNAYADTYSFTTDFISQFRAMYLSLRSTSNGR
jgi:hypothetical protein